MFDFNECHTHSGAAVVLVGKTPTLLGSTCGDYKEYTVDGTLTANDTTVTLAGTEVDETTIDKSANIMNFGYFVETGEIVLAYDKTATSPNLDSVEVIRGVAKRKNLITTSETSFAGSVTDATKIRFTHQFYDLNKEGTNTDPSFWTAHNTMVSNVNIDMETQTFGTSQQHDIDIFLSRTGMSFSTQFPLAFKAEYLRAVIPQGFPMVTSDGATTPKWQAVYTDLTGKRLNTVCVIVIPNLTRTDGNVNDDGRTQLVDSWMYPACAIESIDTIEYSEGGQQMTSVTYRILFDDSMQLYGLMNPFAWTGDHYPTDIA